MHKPPPIYIGSNNASFKAKEVKGALVKKEEESYYKISNVDEMRPFFMSIVSYSNHWMFLSSNGGLSAGRKDSSNAIFPYYTDDKITESAEITGSKTIVQVQVKDRILLWEPFSTKYQGVYKIRRNLYKNIYGNKIIFEEVNEDLDLTFTYQWTTSEKYGFIKKSTLINKGKKSLKLKVLDGIQNIMPYGLDENFQAVRSNLADAYKRSELHTSTGLGMYALSAIIVDKAEPSEALKANLVWSLNVDKPLYLVSSLQLDAFRKGWPIRHETDVKAEKGAYFIHSEMELNNRSEKSWMIVADVNKSIAAVNQIKKTIQNTPDLAMLVEEDIKLGTKKLVALTGNADGIQVTADALVDTRHFSNTLFNIMRGGIFDDNYQIEKADFQKYIAHANKKVFKKKRDLLEDLPDKFSLEFLKEQANSHDDYNFKRLCFEYMPLKFSRRHGDPSRPWNKFSINTKNELDGSKILDYEGNWRDIFQNWEALAYAYPDFIESMIHKFLNATTFDGYNPYRITKGGIDWEIIEPDDPWSYIGYWGDHQLIYLLKFLEFSEQYFPGKLASYFNQEVFVYANVPYKIKNYESILENPKDTIVFNHEADQKIEQKRIELGADGALLRDENFFIYKVNLIEKLLATLLAKISNFIPEAGIWMNTQRPEWNDANNALVGNGVSMVTLYYLRRFLSFFEKTIENVAEENNQISKELVTFFNEISNTLVENSKILSGNFSDAQRIEVLDGLGMAGSDFRENIYDNGFTGDKENITKKELLDFLEITLKYVDHTIEANKRDNNLYHAYNLMNLKGDSEISISYLPEMLEGQVAALSSGFLGSSESLLLLDALKSSSLFREDQYSYILYPNRELPGFESKNNISAERVENVPLLRQLQKDGDRSIVERDVFGDYHFNGNFNNKNSLNDALSTLPEAYDELVALDRENLFNIFEEVFDHKSFTGRSGTFYGYEGLGSIYWHMVSKLALAVQECCLKAINDGESEELIGRLLEHYYEIIEGIGVHKSPELYGAFPTDPYSHTPGGKGAQQPGMTGQVKEDFIVRMVELGIRVDQGLLNFNTRLLRRSAFLQAPKTFRISNIAKEEKVITLEADTLGFTYCQIPILYKIAEREGLKVVFNNQSIMEFDGLALNAEISNKVFQRTGEIDQIIVSINKI
jgi:hypothetical protein